MFNPRSPALIVFKRFYKFLCVRTYLPKYTPPLLHRRNVAFFPLIYRYFHCIYALVPVVSNFTAKTRYAIYTEPNHSDSFLNTLVKKEVLFGESFFSQEFLHCESDVRMLKLSVFGDIISTVDACNFKALFISVRNSRIPAIHFLMKTYITCFIEMPQVYVFNNYFASKTQCISNYFVILL